MEKINLQLYTRNEAAKALSISKKSLSVLVEEGVIGILMIKNQIYIPYQELISFINSNTVKLSKLQEYEVLELDQLPKQKNKTLFDSEQFIKQNRGIRNGKHLS